MDEKCWIKTEWNDIYLQAINESWCESRLLNLNEKFPYKNAAWISKPVSEKQADIIGIIFAILILSCLGLSICVYLKVRKTKAEANESKHISLNPPP